MNDQRIAVFFPGIGYHNDKPLMYYTKKLYSKRGYDLMEVNYTGFESGIKGDPEKMQAAFTHGLSEAERILSSIDWAAYTDIVFVGKSIGTAIAASYAADHHLPVTALYYTPLEQTFRPDMPQGLAFTGTADPWVDHSRIVALCKAHQIPLTTYRGANHSLETGDVKRDLRILQDLTRLVRVANKTVFRP